MPYEKIATPNCGLAIRSRRYILLWKLSVKKSFYPLSRVPKRIEIEQNHEWASPLPKKRKEGDTRPLCNFFAWRSMNKKKKLSRGELCTRVRKESVDVQFDLCAFPMQIAMERKKRFSAKGERKIYSFSYSFHRHCGISDWPLVL